ncbi:XkdX family protein [Paenibacillus solani]|nr:XkdX family protein [Paenibacillus solani]
MKDNGGHPAFTNESSKNFVKANLITEEEYKQQITGIDYVT